ncbi:hypothetical protein EDC61_10310 [Sulfuritortus calidifontis]|uniref:Uncharacterized protein n=1 Tax=Sulfuritortus calidifontis TaxID=1914471 RepID=A0A4R3JZ99_9PROT|nr:hypothetical protein [Sulfuritortus calidifontis]TCS72889.1 hypothetical protein EDC61_10310 [Sulfuritortus calidifontis]
MSKRVSGPPRRPRNPVAKAVRSPAFRMQVVPDKRKKWPKHPAQDEIASASSEDEKRRIEDDADAED